MKLYTKKGDKGETALIGGRLVKKHHVRIEAYGTIDELNSYIGLIHASLASASIKNALLAIQRQLFAVQTLLADENGQITQITIDHHQEQELEKLIDEYTTKLPTLTQFILPGGTVNAAHCHVARCICRRAERLITKLADYEKIPPYLLSYINRLSDYLFVLARLVCVEEGGQEVFWK